MRRLKLFRAWACYWVLSGLGGLPRTWQRKWPLFELQLWLFRYAGYWALRSNKNLTGEQREQLFGGERKG